MGPVSIPTPIYWVQAVPDTNLMSAQLGFPGFSGANISVLTPWLTFLYNDRVSKMQRTIFSRSDWGWFVTSSFTHGVDENSRCNQSALSLLVLLGCLRLFVPSLVPLTWVQSFGNWYFNRSAPQKLFDECGSDQLANLLSLGTVSEASSCNATSYCVPLGLTYAPVAAVAPATKTSPTSTVPTGSNSPTASVSQPNTQVPSTSSASPSISKDGVYAPLIGLLLVAAAVTNLRLTQ